MAAPVPTTFEAEGILVHTTDVVGAGAAQKQHGTEAWLWARSAPSHRTSLAIYGTRQIVQATSVVTRRIEELGHGTDTTLFATPRQTHAVSVWAVHMPVRIHTTATLVAGVPQSRAGTGPGSGPGYRSVLARWIGGASRPPLIPEVIHWTDALRWWIQTQFHRTNALLRQTNSRTHKTDILLTPTQDLIHATNTMLHGSRTRATYINAMLRGEVLRTHTTSTKTSFVYTRFHTTDARRFGTRIRIHTTDAPKARSHQRDHSSDAWLLSSPIAIHMTSTLVKSVEIQFHMTSTVTLRVTVSARWATSRVGTRAPVQVVSKDRKQNGMLYPIGFLLVGHDRITPVLGATPTVQLFKPGYGWVPATGTVRENSNGWYALDANSNDRNVPGEIILKATAPGAETAYSKVDIVVSDPYDGLMLPPAEQASLADATLVRAFASAAAVPVRCLLQAVRALWDWKANTASPLIVKAEDGKEAWRANVVTDPSLPPIRGMDPRP